jgi:hypothetical protein
MPVNCGLELLSLLLLLSLSAISPRQNHSAAHPGDRIYLDVVVSPKSESPMKGLQQSDFTVLDRGASSGRCKSLMAA